MWTAPVQSTLATLSALPVTGQMLALQQLNSGADAEFSHTVPTLEPLLGLGPAMGYRESLRSYTHSNDHFEHPANVHSAWARFYGAHGFLGIGQILYDREQAHLFLDSPETPIGLNMYPTALNFFKQRDIFIPTCLHWVHRHKEVLQLSRLTHAKSDECDPSLDHIGVDPYRTPRGRPRLRVAYGQNLAASAQLLGFSLALGRVQTQTQPDHHNLLHGLSPEDIQVYTQVALLTGQAQLSTLLAHAAEHKPCPLGMPAELTQARRQTIKRDLHEIRNTLRRLQLQSTFHQNRAALIASIEDIRAQLTQVEAMLAAFDRPTTSDDTTLAILSSNLEQRIYTDGLTQEAYQSTDAASLLRQRVGSLFQGADSDEALELHKIIYTSQAEVLAKLPAMTAHFLQYPVRLAYYALAHMGLQSNGPTASSTHYKGLSYFLLQHFIKHGDPDARWLRSGQALQHVQQLVRAYQDVAPFYHHLYELSVDIIDMFKMRGGLDISDLFMNIDRETAAHIFGADMIYFMEESQKYPHRSLKAKLRNSTTQSIRDGLHGTVLSHDDVQRRQRSPMYSYPTLVGYVSRRLAQHPDQLTQFENLLRPAFPEAYTYASPQDEPITWNDLQTQLDTFTPPINGSRPQMMLVGIGSDWKQLERYAQLGFDITLLDPNTRVEQAYQQHRDMFDTLAAAHGIIIRFIKDEIESEELAAAHAGIFSRIEYHNVSTLIGPDSNNINTLLQNGGLLVQFNPHHFERTDLTARGYTTVLERHNIPAILNTPCEQKAYPLGNHLVVLQKVSFRPVKRSKK